MALALSGSVHVNASTASVTTPVLNAAVANCYIIVCIVSNGSSDVVTVKSGSGTNFSLIKSGGESNNWTNVWALFSAGVYNDTVVVTQGSASFCTVDAFGFSGSGQTALVWDTGSPVFNTVDPFNIVTASPNTAVIACFRQTAAANPTAGSGFTQISGADYCLSEYKLVPSPTTTSCTQTIGVGASSGNIAVAILQAGGAPLLAKGGNMAMMGV